MEWAQYDFAETSKVDYIRVFWFHDHLNGGCKVPASWRLLYSRGGQWLPVEPFGDYGLKVDQYNDLRFRPVETDALRIEVQLHKEASSGIHEWWVRKQINN